MSSPVAAAGLPPSPPSSHGSADFHPRGKQAGKPADGNNNPGQQQVLSALQIKKEKFSQSQKGDGKDEERFSGSSEDDESTFEEEPEFIAVRSAKDDSDPLELPLSSDGSLTLATLQSYFSGATGLAKKNPKTGNLRVAFVTFKNSDEELALRPVAEGPNRERVWGTEPLVVVWPRRKRVSSSDEEEEEKPKSNVFRFTATAASSGPPAAKRKFQPSAAPTSNWRLPQKSKGKSNTNQRGGGGAYGLGTMHVKDMQGHMDMNGVRAYFEQFGPVHSLEPSPDPKRMIVRFATYQGAKSAFGNHHIQGVDLVCLPHRHNADRRASVFIHQIPRDLSQCDLSDYFSHFGDVSYVYRPTQFAYSRFGFAFVQFESVADAEEASNTLEHNVRGYRITAHKSRVAF